MSIRRNKKLSITEELEYLHNALKGDDQIQINGYNIQESGNKSREIWFNLRVEIVTEEFKELIRQEKELARQEKELATRQSAESGG